MLLAAVLAICCTVPGSDTPAAKKLPTPVAAVAVGPSVIADNSRNLPDAPIAKSSAASLDSDTSSSEEISAAQPMILNSAVKPASIGGYETARQKKIWYGLVAASHGAAVFDAWSTRRALSGGYGTESDPLLRPFAHSGAIYAATQVSPLVMDYLGYKMMRSNHSWVRKMWWVPQVAGTSVSLSAGVHNYRLAAH